MRLSEGWRAQDQAVLSIEQCRYAVQLLDASLVPCDPRKALVLLEQTLALYGVPDNWEDIAEFYIEAIEDLPEDLLVRALKHVRLTSKWFPKPSELRAPVGEDIARRAGARRRIGYMLEKQGPGRNSPRLVASAS
jgi:hypothetical protein